MRFYAGVAEVDYPKIAGGAMCGARGLCAWKRVDDKEAESSI